MEDNKIFIEDENGKEVEYTILLTFSSEEYNKNYVAYFEEGEEHLYVSTFDPNDTDSGELGAITDDSEWDMIEEVIEAFLMEDGSEES